MSDSEDDWAPPSEVLKVVDFTFCDWTVVASHAPFISLVNNLLNLGPNESDSSQEGKK